MHVLGVPYSTVKNKSTWLPRALCLKRGLTNYKEVLAMCALEAERQARLESIEVDHDTRRADLLARFRMS
jgi:hypothetical protein